MNKILSYILLAKVLSRNQAKKHINKNVVKIFFVVKLKSNFRCQKLIVLD
jgi:hypothetical protein